MKNFRNLMGPEEVCQWLRLPKSTLYKLCRTGAIPCFKIGKHWRFDEEKIRGWLNQRLAGESHHEEYPT
jgi:excisionase family DNA binding protein